MPEDLFQLQNKTNSDGKINVNAKLKNDCFHVKEMRLKPINEDLSKAKETMINFYSALSQCDYDKAAKLFNSSSLKTDKDISLILKDNCSQQLSHCHCMNVLKISDGKQLSPTMFSFTVQFKTADGKIFITGDRGWDKEKGEYYITDFTFTVEKIKGKFKVKNLSGCLL